MSATDGGNQNGDVPRPTENVRLIVSIRMKLGSGLAMTPTIVVAPADWPRPVVDQPGRL